MTRKELLIAIRAELKTNGYTTKQVAVNVASSCYDTRAKITIRDINIHTSDIEGICKKFESIDRCHASGEVLSGGNVYVFIAYDFEAMQAAIEENRERAAAILAESIASINDGGASVIAENEKGVLFFWKEDADCGRKNEVFALTKDRAKTTGRMPVRSVGCLADALTRFDLYGKL